MSRKVVVRRSHKPSFALGVPVNVKIKGERAMRKHVVLDVHPSDPFKVVVKTGQRGRPAHVSLDSIERVRAL
jgi:hypothetical protein